MATTRDIVKRAGKAAAESALRSAIPELQRTLDAIAHDVRSFDSRVFQVDQKIDARFDKLLDAINQLHERVVRVEAKVDAYSEPTRQQLGNTQSLLERVVRVEMTQDTKRRRAS